MGYSPRGRKESDTTERRHFHLFLFNVIWRSITEKAMTPLSRTLAWKIPWTEGLVDCSPWGR